MMGLQTTWRFVRDTIDRFLFESPDPFIVPVLRIGFAVIVLIHTAVLWPDAERWFTDAGVLQSSTAQSIVGSHGWSVLSWLPSNALTIQACLAAMGLSAVLMLLGVFSRVQSAAIWVWLVSFQNRNPFLNDGEDVVMRLFAFFLIWMPLDRGWSLIRRRSALKTSSNVSSTAWGLRLMQFEMAALYASTAICKWGGDTWHQGTATWYVARMGDNFGRWIPEAWFDWPLFYRSTTWGALAIEAILPIALWFRWTRKWAILAGLALHLGIELSMNLFLFQWLMILGLLAFVVPSEWIPKRNSRSQPSSDLTEPAT
ncbi:MAG: HTTM domain-containing protein [Pirellula sp.]